MKIGPALNKRTQKLLIRHRKKINKVHNKKVMQLKVQDEKLRNSYLKQKEQRDIILELIKVMSPDLQKKVVEQLCKEVA